MTAAAISAEFSNYRLVKTRSVLVLELEVPIERQADVFAALGYPMPGESLPVAVARLNPPLKDNELLTSYQPLQPAGASPRRSTSAVVPERAENRDANSFNPLTHYGRDYSDPPAENRDAKTRYAAKTDQEKAAVRAVLLCGDKRFLEWVAPQWRSDDPRWPAPLTLEDRVAAWLRSHLRIASRREIATDYDAYGKFIALENRYKIATGQMAEERG